MSELLSSGSMYPQYGPGSLNPIESPYYENNWLTQYNTNSYSDGRLQILGEPTQGNQGIYQELSYQQSEIDFLKQELSSLLQSGYRNPTQNPVIPEYPNGPIGGYPGGDPYGPPVLDPIGGPRQVPGGQLVPNDGSGNFSSYTTQNGYEIKSNGNGTLTISSPNVDGGPANPSVTIDTTKGGLDTLSGDFSKSSGMISGANSQNPNQVIVLGDPGKGGAAVQIVNGNVTISDAGAGRTVGFGLDASGNAHLSLNTHEDQTSTLQQMNQAGTERIYFGPDIQSPGGEIGSLPQTDFELIGNNSIFDPLGQNQWEPFPIPNQSDMIPQWMDFGYNLTRHYPQGTAY